MRRRGSGRPDAVGLSLEGGQVEHLVLGAAAIELLTPISSFSPETHAHLAVHMAGQWLLVPMSGGDRLAYADFRSATTHGVFPKETHEKCRYI